MDGEQPIDNPLKGKGSSILKIQSCRPTKKGCQEQTRALAIIEPSQPITHGSFLPVIIEELVHINTWILPIILQEQLPYLHLKHKGLLQPYSWPFCSSITAAARADKFICLNCALPSSAIIADRCLCLQNKLNIRFSTKPCLEWMKDHVLPGNLF